MYVSKEIEEPERPPMDQIMRVRNRMREGEVEGGNMRDACVTNS